jgi:hypothetical protein
VHVFAGLIVTAITIWFMSAFAKPWLTQQNTLPNLYYWISFPLVVFLTAFAIRSTIGHRPANPALFSITNDSMVNSLVLNHQNLGFHSF